MPSSLSGVVLPGSEEAGMARDICCGVGAIACAEAPIGTAIATGWATGIGTTVAWTITAST